MLKQYLWNMLLVLWVLWHRYPHQLIDSKTKYLSTEKPTPIFNSKWLIATFYGNKYISEINTKSKMCDQMLFTCRNSLVGYCTCSNVLTGNLFFLTERLLNHNPHTAYKYHLGKDRFDPIALISELISLYKSIRP